MNATVKNPRLVPFQRSNGPFLGKQRCTCFVSFRNEDSILGSFLRLAGLGCLIDPVPEGLNVYRICGRLITVRSGEAPCLDW